jgi:ribokinase
MALIVFGSINMDLVARTPRLPAPAETITGHEFFTAAGGKGANQAVAAAKLGVATTMVGRVGGDGFGSELLQNLQAAGVETAGVLVDPDVSSGVAIIAVDDAAQNNIIIVPGANGRVSESDVARLAEHLPNCDALLLQLEVPLSATIAAAKLARQRGVTVILDPAPAQPLPDDLYTHIDIITPNEVEAAQLVGFPVTTPDDAFNAADALLARGVATAIIKMGALGVVYATQSGERDFVPAFPVQATDTTAAGDAFNGGFAAALLEDLPLAQAVRWGAAAGALSATKAGAQPSMPTRAEFDQFLSRMT